MKNAVSQIASLYAQIIDKLDQSSGAVQLIPAGLSDSNDYWKSHLGLCHYSALSQVYAKGDAKRRTWLEEHRIVFCIKDRERYAAFVRSWGNATRMPENIDYARPLGQMLMARSDAAPETAPLSRLCQGPVLMEF